MKIHYRLKKSQGLGNWIKGKNKSKSHCDKCGGKLYMGPTGVYCDKEHLYTQSEEEREQLVDEKIKLNKKKEKPKERFCDTGIPTGLEYL